MTPEMRLEILRLALEVSGQNGGADVVKTATAFEAYVNPTPPQASVQSINWQLTGAAPLTGIMGPSVYQTLSSYAVAKPLEKSN